MILCWYVCANLLDLGCCLASKEMWIISEETAPENYRQKQRPVVLMKSQYICNSEVFNSI